MAWSIRRYLLTRVLAVALPLAALLAYSLQENYRQALTDAEVSALRISQAVAARNQRFVRDTQEMLAALAARPLARGIDAGRCDPLVGEITGLLPRFADLVIGHSKRHADSIGRPFPDRQALLLAEREEPGATVAGDGTGARLMAFSRIGGTDWRVIGVQPTDAALRDLWLRDGQKYLLAALLILFGSGAAFFFSRRIAFPIDHIAHTAQRVADGLSDARARVEGPTEVGGIALHFNRMLDVRMKAEAKYRSLLESALDAVLVIDAQGRMILVNAQAEREFGYSRDEMLGQPIEMLVGENQKAKHQQHVADHLTAPSARRHARHSPSQPACIRRPQYP